MKSYNNNKIKTGWPTFLALKIRILLRKRQQSNSTVYHLKNNSLKLSFDNIYYIKKPKDQERNVIVILYHYGVNVNFHKNILSAANLRKKY